MTPREDELVAIRRANPSLSERELEKHVRFEQLKTMIIREVLANFAVKHDVEPTAEELSSLKEFFELDRDDKESMGVIFTDDDPMVREFVRQWKLSKALYEEFGGEVIFQQGNPMEAIGGLRALLKRHESNGDFAIYDSAFRKMFWDEYHSDHGPFVIPPHEVDFSKPWWTREYNKASPQ